MKKTLVALTLAALTTGAFADTTVYQTDQGRVYVDGNVRLSGVLFNNKTETTSGNTTSVTQRYNDGRSYVLRLVLGGGFDAKVGEKGTFGAYLSYYKEFYTSKYTNDLTSTVVKGHNGRPVYLKVGRFYYDYDNFVRVTFGLRGEKDAAQYWQFTDALEYARDEYVLTANHLVLGARTAFDLVDRVNYAPGTDKRTVRADFFFGENKEHYASVSYADNKTASSSEYGTQFAGVYGYKGFKDLVLQVVASAGH
ncbi:hypothetical protein CJP74_01855 [Psittacicella melopsittaci]|uniref:Porin n=1 Tax=Psittacicella melopsittaci TaxID=2028576 RepID=A0A3A1Y7A7_9GAMM|nr:hypothetical protein [Psittacicella melopsittaci]RIY33495.1 hypothetical protein CJP74_01855 [Psittacicella melopsittaci]